MMRGNKQKSTLDLSSLRSTRTVSDAIASGHLVTNGLQGSAESVKEPGQAAVKLLEQCKYKTWTHAKNQDTITQQTQQSMIFKKD